MTTLREIARGALTRFVPGAAAAVLVVEFVIDRQMLSDEPWQELFVTTAMLSALGAVGYSLAMALMRRRLPSDAGIVGRKSVIAGAVSVGVVWSLLTVRPINAIELWASPVAGGLLATLGIYFPWLSGSRDAPDAPAELPMATPEVEWNRQHAEEELPPR